MLDSIPQIIETGIQLLTSLVAALPEIIMAIVEAIPKIIDGIINAVLNAIPLIIQAGIDLLISLIQALPQIITTIVQAIPQIISGIVNALVGNIDKIIMAGVQLFVALIENLPTIIVEIVKAVPQIIAGIVKAFGSLMYKIVEIGGNIVKGLWSGITQLASWLWDKVSGWISSIWDGICDFFGIHSPSKEMAWVGEMLVKGLAGSIDDNGDEAVKAAEGMAEDINGVMGDLAHDMQTALPTDFDVNGSIRSAVDGVAGKAASAFTIALNIATFDNCGSEDIRQLTTEVIGNGEPVRPAGKEWYSHDLFYLQRPQFRSSSVCISRKRTCSPHRSTMRSSFPFPAGAVTSSIRNRRFANIKVTYTVFLARKNTAALAAVLRDIKGWLYSEAGQIPRAHRLLRQCGAFPLRRHLRQSGH